MPILVYGQETNSLNRVTASLRLPLNFGVRFSGPIGFKRQTDPGPATGGAVNREYDDGYVRVDSDRNAAGLTWNWGYQNSSQLAADDSLHLHSAEVSPAGTASRTTDDPATGMEIAWERELIRGERWEAGFTFAFNYTSADIRDRSAIVSSAQILTDVYPLGGIIAPADPTLGSPQYRGAFDVPGPVIGDAPLRREVRDARNGAITTGERRLDLSLWGCRFGPWVELPLNKTTCLFAGVGVAWALADSELSLSELTTLTSGVHFPNAASRHTNTWLVGGYVDAGLRWTFGECWSLSSAFEYQRLDRFTVNAGSRYAEVDLSNAYILRLGLGYSF